ncbi:hypothetical protein GCM10010198_65080 [Nocardia seriolae]
MTDSPRNFADSPDGGEAGGLDALSEILETVRLRGRSVTRHDAEPGAPLRVPSGRRVLHIVERGTVRIRVDGEFADTGVHSGDMVVLARGDAHTLEALDGPARWVTGSFQVDEPQAAPLLSVLAPAITISGTGPGRAWLPLSLDLLLAEVTDPRPGRRP